MIKARNELQFVLMMFHDFILEKLTLENEVLNMQVQTPYEIEGQPNRFLKLNYYFHGCNTVEAEYTLLPDNSTVNIVAQEISELGKVKLSVQSVDYLGESKYVWLCNGSDGIAGGKVYFTTQGVQVYTQQGDELSLAQLESLFKQHWNWSTIDKYQK